MEPEDLLPRAAKPQQRNLAPMSVEELEAYIGELEAEIARVRQDIEKKTKHRSSAESLFRR
ncbi:MULTISPECIES: DUF1192 domain-containing protein [Oceanibaculum]|uniref:DUF1192 domain-containing protein n=1 Tax=Oceanibaculum indicum P24 TaxID=1207063 RepID=K2JF99_9PROT|nr:MULTISPECIES: DUF1192 domain-containing protein [Oceanibaculum]EKE73788.1 hypothetical protein P24_12517 [Oceanibaculum indicum P24]MCH2393198.1 DUF1192 domain-containing protein [Oceanibaculum sp.]